MKVDEKMITLIPRLPVHIGSGVEELLLKDGNKFYRVKSVRNPQELFKYLQVLENVQGAPIYQLRQIYELEEVHVLSLGLHSNKYRVFIRDSNGTPYLPGSSIKGSIRTAILWKVLEENYLLDDLYKYMKEKGARAPWGSRLSTRIFNEYFQEKLNVKDAKEDPFRALKVEDTFLKEDQLALAEARRIYIKINNKMHTKKVKRTPRAIVEAWYTSEANVKVSLDQKLWDYLWSRVKKVKRYPADLDEILDVWQEFYRRVAQIWKEWARREVFPTGCNNCAFLGWGNGWTAKTVLADYVYRQGPNLRPVNIIIVHGKTRQGWPLPKTLWMINKRPVGVVEVRL